MARILWISDGGTSTGFSRVTHAIGERLVEMGHEIHVLAIGYDGADPQPGPLLLYRADATVDVMISGRTRRAQHGVGFHRVVELLDRVKPDKIVTLMDAPLLLSMLMENPFDPDKRLAARGDDLIAYLPIDGYELPRTWTALGRLVSRIVAMSNFGVEQLHEIDVEAFDMIHHGVDTSVFYPVSHDRPLTISTGDVMRSRNDCREALEIPQDAFVIGRVDTNSGRKDWPATWRVIDLFLHGRRGVLPVFHTKVSNPGHGVDLGALFSKSSGGKYMVTGGGSWPVTDLVALLNTFDVFLTTSRGEGFGLGLLESAACGVPALAPRHSAIEEVVGSGGILVDPLEEAFWSNPYGVTMKLSDTVRMADALGLIADNEGLRHVRAKSALSHAQTFSWDEAARRFDQNITGRAALRDLSPAASGGGA